MKKRKLGKNRGIWCGVVVSKLELSHELKKQDDDTVIERFFKFDVETEIKNKKGELKDASILPVIISETKLNELEQRPEVGKIVFLKGSWRTYDHPNSTDAKKRLEQNIYVKSIEVHNDYPVKTRNKFEFEGVLVKKIFEIERDAEGNPLKDEFGRLIPKKDEKGNAKYTVRKNKEGHIVNDFIVAINRPNGSDYVPCIAYRKLANYIAEEVEVASEVEGYGYIRMREYEFAGEKQVAYEAVITSLTVKQTEEEQEEE